MATNYERGAAFERRVMADLSGEGYEVFRSAGSHGKADVVAIKPGEVLLIQCKRSGEISREEWNEIVRLRQALDPLGRTVRALLALMPGSRGIAYRELLYQLEHGERRRLASQRWTPDQIGAEDDHHDDAGPRALGSR